MKTAKQLLSEYTVQNYCFVVKGVTSGMYVDINDLFERDINEAQAFANYEDAMEYIKGSKYPSLLVPVKYNPTATDDDIEEQDLCSDMTEDEIRIDRANEDAFQMERERGL